MPAKLVLGGHRWFESFHQESHQRDIDVGTFKIVQELCTTLVYKKEKKWQEATMLVDATQMTVVTLKLIEPQVPIVETWRYWMSQHFEVLTPTQTYCPVLIGRINL